MDTKLVRATPHDAQLLWQLQREAFAGLLSTYQDFDTNPACETLDRICAKLEQPFTYFYLIRVGDQTVGAVRIVNKKTAERKRISPLFILPSFRGRGLAQKAIAMCEDIHGADNWQLLTIMQEAGNCHLYEKMGYRRTGQTVAVNDRMTLVVYEK